MSHDVLSVIFKKYLMSNNVKTLQWEVPCRFTRPSESLLPWFSCHLLFWANSSFWFTSCNQFKHPPVTWKAKWRIVLWNELPVLSLNGQMEALKVVTGCWWSFKYSMVIKIAYLLFSFSAQFIGVKMTGGKKLKLCVSFHGFAVKT